MSKSKSAAQPVSPAPTLRHALRHVNRTYHSHFSSVLEKHGLTVASYRSMFALRRYPNMSSADLARWAGVTAQGANQVLKGLVRAGYVERHPSPVDGRILQSKLTTAGQEVIAECEEVGQELEEMMTSLMTPEDVREFERLLYLAADAMGVPIQAH